MTNPTSTTVRSTSTPAVNTWTHLAGAYDAAAGTMTLYVNGTAQGSSAVARPFTARGPLVIGATWSRRQHGRVDHAPGPIGQRHDQHHDVGVRQQVRQLVDAVHLFGRPAGRSGPAV